jgi:hypothetical protein
MLALSDAQLQVVMTAAGGLPVEKRGVFLERVAARLRLRSGGFSDRSRHRRAPGAAGPDPRNRGLTQHRRFPPPWSVEEQSACFVVRVRYVQALAYIYFEDEPGRRSAAKLLTREEADCVQYREVAGAVAQALLTSTSRPAYI